MNHKCLNSLEVADILKHIVTDVPPLEEELAAIMESAKCWDLTVVCYALFAARYLNSGEQGREQISGLYELSNNYAFEIQEGGDQLINFLLRHIRRPNETLDEALITIQDQLSEYDYTATLRY